MCLASVSSVIKCEMKDNCLVFFVQIKSNNLRRRTAKCTFLLWTIAVYASWKLNFIITHYESKKGCLQKHATNVWRSNSVPNVKIIPRLIHSATTVSMVQTIFPLNRKQPAYSMDAKSTADLAVYIWVIKIQCPAWMFGGNVMAALYVQCQCF